MKYLFVALLAVMLCGCGKPTAAVVDTELQLNNMGGNYTIRNFEHDGCEYIAFGQGCSLTITHKGNCKYCRQRNK